MGKSQIIWEKFLNIKVWIFGSFFGGIGRSIADYKGICYTKTILVE